MPVVATGTGRQLIFPARDGLGRKSRLRIRNQRPPKTLNPSYDYFSMLKNWVNGQKNGVSDKPALILRILLPAYPLRGYWENMKKRETPSSAR